MLLLNSAKSAPGQASLTRCSLSFPMHWRRQKYVSKIQFDKSVWPAEGAFISDSIAALRHLWGFVTPWCEDDCDRAWRRLHGTVPLAFAQLPKLSWLQLIRTSFSLVPPELLSIPTMRDLNMERNALSGGEPTNRPIPISAKPKH